MNSTQKSFIETQFPVSKVSKESYKERMANLGQTLTGLGKWWGRKPLVMVRAALVGLLMPAGSDPVKDREIFLKIMTMDETGLLLRKDKSIPLIEVFNYLTPAERQVYFNVSKDIPRYKQDITPAEKQELQKEVFNRMSYDEKLRYCKRPEHVDSTKLDWHTINSYLGTNAANIQELLQELGRKKFGHVPTVGDCFCGGGSVPFEAARLGLNVYASELNPIAVLLTWASLHILGSSETEMKQLRAFQEKIYNLADEQITRWAIEHNEDGWRAVSYLYCVETRCPECGYHVPLAPSWVIGKGTKTIALLKKNDATLSFDLEIKSDVSKAEMIAAEAAGTVKGDSLVCPNPDCRQTIPITSIRGDRTGPDGSVQYGLRRWEKDEFIPRPDDVLQERLYCIRYVEEYMDDSGNIKTRKHYVTPTSEDKRREEKVISLLRERFEIWQKNGYIPVDKIEDGEETTRLLRERGWTYWHQLYNPRQLLAHGLLMKLIDEHASKQKEKVITLLGINKCSDFNSKLSRWLNLAANENNVNAFYNQSLNSLYNYGTKSLYNLKTSWFFSTNNVPLFENSIYIRPIDARQINTNSTLWITDPPYADAVNYHELSEFFLSWDKNLLSRVFPEWYTDSKRPLAVKGRGYSFNQSMIEIYKNLAKQMPDNGMQLVMFTHQDVKVWAELALIIWAAGLRVTAAWNIATETDASGLKDGNYVKGTVLLVLRKQTSEDTIFEDELIPEIEDEVKRQIESMREMDDREDPNFNDADYLLAAYAASLKVLTSYKNIAGLDVQRVLSRERQDNEPSPVEKLIRTAVKIAYDYLIPQEFDRHTWKMLSPGERFYIKGLEFEKSGTHQLGAFQELARGFGAKDYDDMLATRKANQTRLKTASEFKMGGMQGDDAKTSVVRNALAAIYRARQEENPAGGRNWLRHELDDYWNKKNLLLTVLEYLSVFEHHSGMSHWHEDARYARLIKELVKNDGM
ncbi:MAG: anti-phage-associated DUF1156 domain-containing protein [Bacillota bacterium]